MEGQEEKDRTIHLGEKTALNVSLEVRRADSEESHPQIPSEWRNIRQPTDGTTRPPVSRKKQQSCTHGQNRARCISPQGKYVAVFGEEYK